MDGVDLHGVEGGGSGAEGVAALAGEPSGRCDAAGVAAMAASTPSVRRREGFVSSLVTWCCPNTCGAPLGLGNWLTSVGRGGGRAARRADRIA